MHHALIFNTTTIWFQRPGGAHRIASFLREQGWDVEVLDWAPYWTQEELREWAQSKIKSNTVFCGFSCFFGHWDSNMEQFAQWIKDTYPNIKNIIGGSSKPRMESKAIDYFVYGYGENAMMAIVASLTGNTPGTGISFDPNYLAIGKKVVNANDFYPAHPMRRAIIKYEDRDYIESHEWLTVEYSRGCMFECLYCNFPVLGVKGDYTRDADDYVEQLRDAYDRFGVTNYYASDETFNDRSDKILKFADATEQLPFQPFVSGFIRGDLLVSREQDWQHLSRMGFLGHFYGVETFNHASAKAIGKGMNPQKLQDGILKAREYFKTHDRKLYRGLIALIVGLPHETKESMKAGADWILENWQGEAIDFTPLEIPIDEFSDKISKLGKNWKKWGYENDNDSTLKFEKESVNVNHSIKNLQWKNPHMDLNWAKEFSYDFYKNRAWDKTWGIHNFQLDWAAHCGYNTIEEMINVPAKKVMDAPAEFFWRRIKTYKSKKLGTTPDHLTDDFPKYNPWGS